MAIGPDRPRAKVSCRRIALKRCNATDARWNKNEVSLSLPDTSTEIKSEDEELNVPKFCTALGWEIRFVGTLLYFIYFRSAATIHTPVAALSAYDCAIVLTTVT